MNRKGVCYDAGVVMGMNWRPVLDSDPRFDLDMASSSLGKYLERGKGTTYPEMPWEPKPSFRAVPDFYSVH